MCLQLYYVLWDMGWQPQMLLRELRSLENHTYPILASPIHFAQHKGRSLTYQMGKEGKGLLVF